MKIRHLGWVASATVLGIMLSSGFQGKTEKTGVVDLQRVYAESSYTARKQDELKNYRAQRVDVMNFFKSYRTLTPEQAAKFKELSLKTPITPAEKTELDKIKADAIASEKTLRDLQTKQNPTPEDSKKLQELGDRSRALSGYEQQLSHEFEDGMRDLSTKMQEDVIAKMDAAVAEVAKKNGYTIVFSRSAAPYAANDVTTETIAALNAKK